MFHNDKLKSGFTLVELMVFFVFITLLLAASTPLITKRVKSLPARVYHGKFMCYRGADGQLHQEYYNTVRNVSSEVVTECSFEPPKKATLFKVEMVGAGAGGYNYIGDRTVSDDDKSGRYDIGTGFTCIHDENCSYSHAAPTGMQLRYIFNNQRFTQKALVSGAGDGESLEVRYVPIDTIYWDVKADVSDDIKELLTSKCNDENITLSEEEKAICTLDANQRAAAIVVRNNIRTDVTNCGIKGGSCYALGGQNNLNKINAGLTYSYVASFSADGTKTAQGGYGGDGGYVAYYGNIDFIDHSQPYTSGMPTIANDEIDSYLKSLPNHFSSGAMSESAAGGSCAGFQSDYLEDPNWKDWDYYSPTRVTVSTQGEKGSDVARYDAIKVWDRCVSVKNRATGGTGAKIDIFNDQNSDPEHLVLYKGENGNDASGVVGDENVAPYLGSGHSFAFSTTGGNAYPYMAILTKLSKVSYDLGKNGTSGESKSFFVSSLRDDCKFYVPAGGRALTVDDTAAIKDNLEKNLYTSLSCNDDTVKHSVKGGTYTWGYETITHSQWEHMSDYKAYLDSGSSGTPPSYTSEFQAEVSNIGSNYVPLNIFLKYNISGDNFGAGGTGPIVRDGCMTPTGVYSHSLYDQNGNHVSSKDKQYNLPAVQCDAKTKIQKTEAADGSGGAIIITW